MKKFTLIFVVWLLSAASCLSAETYQFTSIVPEYRSSAPYGINSSGWVVGRADASALLWHTGTSQTFDIAGAIYTEAMAINDHGQIVGNWMDSGYYHHGFATTTTGFGTVTEITSPGTNNTVPMGINNEGVIVCYYNGPDSALHGFLRQADGTCTTIDHPGTSYSAAMGINDAGIIVGQWQDDSVGIKRGWIRDVEGNFTNIDIPTSSYTIAQGINNASQIAGYWNDSGGLIHGFMQNASGSLTILDFPGADQTYVNGISNTGQLTGHYLGQDGYWHGFVASPVPEPTTLLLLTIGGLFLRKRKV
jgi:uncharacterized membrane protein